VDVTARGAGRARAAGADDRTRQQRGRERRDRIVSEAIELFARKGFRGSSITELAERVGMTHPGLLYWFGTKERLLLDVVHEREEREGDAMAASLAEGATTVVELLRGTARFVAETPLLTRLYVVLAAENLDDGEPLHEFFATRYDQARTLVTAALEREQERGDAAADVDCAQVGREVIATLMGLEIQWLMDPEAIDYPATVDAYADALATRLAPG
jgi:AcrR family transcriptional regulator